MASGYLWGWDNNAAVWVRIECDANGFLKVDPTMLFENPPTEDLATKGPSSEWAFDHNANANAHHTPTVAGDLNHQDLANRGVADHHAKYTDVESRAAIGDQLDATGKMLQDLQCDYKKIQKLNGFYCQDHPDSTYWGLVKVAKNDPIFIMNMYKIGTGYKNADIWLYQTDHYSLAIHDDSFQAALALYLEEAPTNGVVNKAPTSNWAFDHNANVSAHHAKYTDAEALAACKLNSNVYWSCVGAAFMSASPDTDTVTLGNNGIITANGDDIVITAPVDLPNGVTITNVIVRGNAAAEAQPWYLYRLTLSDLTLITLATANVNTADATIAANPVDNSLYGYFLLVFNLDTDDAVHGSVITYTL